MDKIFVNNKVMDAYRAGFNLNDAINSVYADVISKRKEEDKKLDKLSPLQIAMHDAGINKYSSMDALMNTARYGSGGIDSNEWLFPAWVESTLRESAYAENVVSYFCSTSVGVDSNLVKTASLDLLDANNKKNVRKARIAEGADIPLAKIRVNEGGITLWKHGRAIEMTYEAVRRMRIDIFSKHMNAIVNDISNQSFEDAVNTAIDGDGNTNSAATSLGSLTTANTITSSELVGFLVDYWEKNHFAADTITVPLKFYKQIFSMTFDSQLVSGISQKVSFNTPQLGIQNITVLAAENMPKVGDKEIILFTNRNSTLIRYEENGSNIQENQSFARNQTNLLTATENSGYAINMIGSNMYVSNK